MKLTCLRALMLCLATQVLTGCASGPTYDEIKSTIPPVAADRGRVYFYRTQVLGAAVQPDIHLNSEVVGSSKPQGFFFVDRAPGDYEASCTTEVERKLSFVLAAGEERFVESSVTMGLLVGHGVLKLVDPEQARSDLGPLHFTGTLDGRAAAAGAGPSAVQSASSSPTPTATVAAPEPLPVPVAARAATDLTAGQRLRLPADLALRSRPYTLTAIREVLPAGTPVTLDRESGRYWRVTTADNAGWLLAAELR